jgi:hypothetical protein
MAPTVEARVRFPAWTCQSQTPRTSLECMQNMNISSAASALDF